MNLLKELQEKLNNSDPTFGTNGMSLEKVFYEASFSSNPIYREFLEEYNCDLELLQDTMEEKVEIELISFPIKVTPEGTPTGTKTPTRMINVKSVELHTNKKLHDILERYNESSKDEKDEKKLFAIFIYSLYEIELKLKDQEFSVELSECMFDWDKFLFDMQSGGKKSAIEELCINLNEKAKKGQIDPIIGREKEIIKVIEILNKRKKANPLLKGPAGVGKTTIPEGIALKIVNGEVPDSMKDATIYYAAVAEFVSGTMFRGQFEEKVMNLIKELQERKENGEFPILFIDEIHSIVGSGNTNGLDFGNILKPALADGSIACIGATTDEEYTKFMNREKALKRRFVPVDVKEPTVLETIEILMGIKNKYEKKHGVKYDKESILRCVELSDRYITNTARPDKCIDLMDYVGAVAKVHQKEVNKEYVDFATSKYTLQSLASIQMDNKEADEKKKLELGKLIKQKVYGQDLPIQKIVDVVELNLAGFKDSDKTLGNFLLTGPTGVGKTEFAVQLAENLKIPMERIDMSEFMEAHSVSKFIGAPPGFVGFDQDGKFTKLIQKNPRCVILLDEIEKAHPKVLDILLQVMDHAKVTDSQGQELSFKDTIILMTSNAGAKELQTSSIGLAKGKVDTVQKGKSDKEINSFFTPEFRGRLDAIVNFNQLSIEHTHSIIDKFVKEIEKTEGALKMQLSISLDKKAKDYIVKIGFDPKYGARDLKKVLKTEVTKVIAKESLYGKTKKGKNSVKVTVKNGKLSFSFC